MRGAAVEGRHTHVPYACTHCFLYVLFVIVFGLFFFFFKGGGVHFLGWCLSWFLALTIGLLADFDTATHKNRREEQIPLVAVSHSCIELLFPLHPHPTVK